MKALPLVTLIVGCLILATGFFLSQKLDPPPTPSPCTISQEDVHLTAPPGATEMNIRLKFRACDTDWAAGEYLLFRIGGNKEEAFLSPYPIPATRKGKQVEVPVHVSFEGIPQGYPLRGDFQLIARNGEKLGSPVSIYITR